MAKEKTFARRQANSPPTLFKMQYHQEVEKIFSVMEAGGIVIVPLDVGYALLFTKPDCIEKIYQIKKRSKEKPLVCLGDEKTIAEIFVNNKNSKFYYKLGYPVGLIGKFKTNYVDNKLCTKNGKIAIFVNMGEFADDLVRFSRNKGKIVFGSSANISGAGNHFEVKDIEKEIFDKVDYVLDLGKTRYSEFHKDGRGMSSTMIDIEDNQIVRKGLLYKEIKDLLKIA